MSNVRNPQILAHLSFFLGLTNKSSGVVRKIVESKDKKDPDIILVEFDGFKGKDIVQDINGNSYPNLVPIAYYTQSG